MCFIPPSSFNVNFSGYFDYLYIVNFYIFYYYFYFEKLLLSNSAIFQQIIFKARLWQFTTKISFSSNSIQKNQRKQKRKKIPSLMTKSRRNALMTWSETSRVSSALSLYAKLVQRSKYSPRAMEICPACVRGGLFCRCVRSRAARDTVTPKALIALPPSPRPSPLGPPGHEAKAAP